MSTTSRKVTFEAEDNGVLSTFERLQRSARDLTSEIMQGSASYTTSGKEQLKYIEDQIKAIERRNQVDKDRQLVDARGARASALEEGLDPKSAAANFSSSAASIEKLYEEDKLQTDLMRQMVEEIKLGAQAEVASDREGVKERIAAMRSEDFQRLAESDSEEALKAKIQKDMIGDVQDAEEEQSRKFAMPGEEEINRTLTGLAENPIAMAASAIPFIGGILGIMAVKGAQLDNAASEYRRGTGGTYDSSIDAGLNVANFGLSNAEFANISKEYQQSVGRRDAAGAWGAATVNTALGIDYGTINQLMSTSRSQRQQEGVQQQVSEMLGVFRKSKLFDIGPNNFVNIQEKIEFQSQLNTMQAAQMEKTMDDTSTRVQQAFGRVGGSFADQRALGTISTVNQALMNPDNDYKQAFLLNSLQSIKPGASLFELREMQEKGVFQTGFVSQVMGDLSEKYGGKDVLQQNKAQKDMFMSDLKNMLGLGYEQSRKMADSYLSGRATFKEIGWGTKGNNFEMTPDVGDTDILLAKTSNTLASGGKAAIDWVAQQVDEIQEHGFMGYLGNKISEMFSGIVDSIAGMFKDLVSSIGGFFEDVGTWIAEGFESMIDSLGEFFSDLGSALNPMNWFSDEETELAPAVDVTTGGSWE